MSQSQAGSPPETLSATLLACVVLVVWTAINAFGLWNNWAEDLAAVYVAGWLWDHGQAGLIYATPEHFFGGQAESWTPVLEAIGGPSAKAFPYVYPPLWAVVAAPVTRFLSATDFFNAMLVLQTGLLGYGLVVTHRLARPPLPLWKWLLVGCALLQVTVPFVTALKQCQPSILVTVLTLLAVERSVNGAPRRAGACLALAAAIKLTPVLFVLILLQRRDWTALRWFAGTGLVLAGASLGLAGLQPHLDFLQSLRLAGNATLVSSVNLSARSLVDMVLVLAGSEPTREADRFYIFMLSPAAQLLSSAVNAIAFAAISAWIWRKAKALPPVDAAASSTFVLSVALALFGPLGWQHYYLLPIMLLPCLFGIASPKQLALIALPVLLVENIASFDLMLDAGWPPTLYVSVAVCCWLFAIFLVGKRVGPANR